MKFKIVMRFYNWNLFSNLLHMDTKNKNYFNLMKYTLIVNNAILQIYTIYQWINKSILSSETIVNLNKIAAIKINFVFPNRSHKNFNLM